MTQTQDDFLVQVQRAEKKAAENLKRAQEQAQANLDECRRKLNVDLEKKCGAAREHSKSKLRDAQVKGRGVYEELVREGDREALKVEKDGLDKISKLLPGAEVFFLNDVLSVS